MNRTRVLALVGSVVLAALVVGCGGSNSSSATVGGAVTGLEAGTSVSLAMNGGTPITLTTNTSFTFSGTLASATGYNVAVTTQPVGQTCVVTYGSGLIDYSGNSVTDVTVNCTANIPIGVTVSGLLPGNSVTFNLVLQNDPANIQAPLPFTSNGTADFPVLLPLGTIYSISVATQPTSPVQVCAIPTATPTSTPPNPSGGVVGSTPIVVDFKCT